MKRGPLDLEFQSSHVPELARRPLWRADDRLVDVPLVLGDNVDAFLQLRLRYYCWVEAKELFWYGSPVILRTVEACVRLAVQLVK